MGVVWDVFKSVCGECMRVCVGVRSVCMVCGVYESVHGRSMVSMCLVCVGFVGGDVCI